MQSTRVYLVRHGQVEGHEEQRYNGQANVALTPLGREQSRHIGAHLAGCPLDAVYSSDLDRSRYCAELIAGEHGLSVVCSDALRELHIGDWQGRTWAELQNACPDDWQARLEDLVHFQVPGGESLLGAAERVRPVLSNILADHEGGHVVIVAHGGVNRIILLDAMGASLEEAFSIEQDYGCLNIIDYSADGDAVVRLFNDTGHHETA